MHVTYHNRFWVDLACFRLLVAVFVGWDHQTVLLYLSKLGRFAKKN